MLGFSIFGYVFYIHASHMARIILDVTFCRFMDLSYCRSSLSTCNALQVFL